MQPDASSITRELQQGPTSMGLVCSWQNLSVGILNRKVPMRLNKLFSVKLKLIQSSQACLRVGTATAAVFHAVLFCHAKHNLHQNGEKRS